MFAIRSSLKIRKASLLVPSVFRLYSVVFAMLPASQEQQEKFAPSAIFLGAIMANSVVSFCSCNVWASCWL